MSAWDKSTHGQNETQSARLRALPSVTTILDTTVAAELMQRFGRATSTEAIRVTVDDARTAIKAGAPVPGAHDLALQALARLDEQDRSGLRPLFNLTGTILHTNLGRAVLAESAVEAATAAMRDAVALEFDLSTGTRGERDDHVRALLCDLTGAEDATVVNNNAAAVLLCLNTMAQDREAIVSRGELIEIGGAFRMPDVMARAGTKMIEVGTTNRTHAKDYRAVLSAQTGIILKVHTSNYRIQGFTAEVSAAELASIAGEQGVPLLNDLGSGTLIDLCQFGLQKEPIVREAVAQGAGLVTFSGDKLLGGPQAGFIVGQKALITEINRNPRNARSASTRSGSLRSKPRSNCIAIPIVLQTVYRPSGCSRDPRPRSKFRPIGCAHWWRNRLANSARSTCARVKVRSGPAHCRSKPSPAQDSLSAQNPEEARWIG
jgi:L-seryl-tRNA(Ser) seleniumtransferase